MCDIHACMHAYVYIYIERYRRRRYLCKTFHRIPMVYLLFCHKLKFGHSSHPPVKDSFHIRLIMPSDKSHQVREILDSGGSTKYMAHLNQCVARTNEPLPAEHGLVDLYIYICIYVYMYMANWWQKNKSFVMAREFHNRKEAFGMATH